MSIDRRKIDRGIGYLLIAFGFAFGGVSLYYSVNDPSTYSLFGFLAGMMLSFCVADRNVYKERLINLFNKLGEVENVEIEIERTEYTDYIVQIKTKDE